MTMEPYTEGDAFFYPLRVYYEDTDAGGVVYHSTYLNFCERARTEWLRTLGFEQHELRGELGIIFVVRRASVDYRRPARLDNVLTIESRVTALGKVRFTMRQTIRHHEKTLCTVDIEIVCIDSSFAPTQIPAEIRARLSQAPMMEEKTAS